MPLFELLFGSATLLQTCASFGLGIASNHVDDAVFAKLPGYWREKAREGKLDQNHDLEKAFNKAYLQATKMAIEASLKRLEAIPKASRSDKNQKSIDWLNRAKQAFEQELRQKEAIFSYLLPKDDDFARPEQLFSSKRPKELEAVLLETLSQTLAKHFDPPVPEEFVAKLSNDWQSAAMPVGWLTAFEGFFLEIYKTNARVQTIYDKQILDSLQVMAVVNLETLTKLKEDLQITQNEVLTRIAETKLQLGERLDKLQDRLDAQLPSLLLFEDLDQRNTFLEDLLIDLHNKVETGFAEQEAKARERHEDLVRLLETLSQASQQQVRQPSHAKPDTLYGREAVLAEIAALIVQNQHVQVYGYPGVGKSALLKQFAYEQQAELAVALVDMRAMSSENLPLDAQLDWLATQAVAQFVPEFSGQALAFAKHMFNSEASCLLIDNLEDPNLLKRVRESLNPKRLLVSGREQASRETGLVFKNLMVLPAEESKALFREVSGHASGYDAEVEQIVRAMAGLPFALRLLAAFTKENELNPKDIVQELQTNPYLGDDTQINPGDSRAAEFSVETAFELSFQRLGKDQNSFLSFGLMSANGGTCATVGYLTEQSLLATWQSLQRLTKLSLLEKLPLNHKSDSDDWLRQRSQFRTHALLKGFAQKKVEQTTDSKLAERFKELFAEAMTCAETLEERQYQDPRLDFLDIHKEQIAYLCFQKLAVEPEGLDFGVIASLGNRFAELGHREEALELYLQVEQFYRGQAKEDPEAFLPNLAMSLNNLSTSLSDLGRREEALAAIEEATGIRRQLAKTRPDAFLPNLALALNNLSTSLSDLGRREEALAAIEEATEIRRQLAKTRPDAFLPNLAMSLNNLSTSLSDLGRREEALAAIEEATESYRQLAKARPDAFLPDLAMSLNNLSNSLSDLGRREEALAAIEEATGIRRQLAKTRPDAFLPDLALSLWTFAWVLDDFDLAKASSLLEEAINVLEKPFLRYPQVYTDWMQRIIAFYKKTSEKAGLEPDADLLERIERHGVS